MGATSTEVASSSTEKKQTDREPQVLK